MANGMGGNGAMDPADVHMHLMVLQDDFHACRARSMKEGGKQMELLQALQKEITRFETDVSKKLIDLKRDIHALADLKKEVHQIFEFLTNPRKKKKAKVST